MTINEQQWRNLMGMYVTGVNVVTTVDADGKPVGFTANAFSSVSLEPPLLLVCADKKSETLKSVIETKRFCVNMLCQEQETIAMTFASKKADKFADITYRTGVSGLPVIEGCIGSIELELVDLHPAADHFILIGKGLTFYSGDRVAMPLTFFGGQFHRLSI